MFIFSYLVTHLRVDQLSEALSLSQKFKISVRTPQKTNCVFIVRTNAVNEHYRCLFVESYEIHEYCVLFGKTAKIEIFSVGQKTECAEGRRNYTPFVFILETLYENEYNLHLLCVSSFSAKYLTISCVIRNSYVSVTAFNAPVLYRHTAHYLTNMLVQEVTSLYLCPGRY